MKTGVYLGPGGQLVEVYKHKEFGIWHNALTLRLSDNQSIWLERGSMSEEIKYLILGFTYLGKL